jgi:hypothetical protein
MEKTLKKDVSSTELNHLSAVTLAQVTIIPYYRKSSSLISLTPFLPLYNPFSTRSQCDPLKM